MQVGDLIAYDHDREQTGLIVGFDFKRGEDNVLVVWRRASKCGKRKWYVSPKWLVMVQPVKKQCRRTNK